MGNGQASNPFNQVSWEHPFGDSAIGNALGRAPSNQNAPLNPDGTSKQTGEQVIVPGTNNLSNTNTPQFGGGFVNNNPPSSTTSSPFAPTTSPTAFGMRAPMRNTSGEDSFRNSYMSSLKPNTAFTFNAQNPSTFGIPSAKK